MKRRCTSVSCEAPDTSAPCHRLGPYPATAVAALADLGLSDQEISGYFRIPTERVRRLRIGIAPELRLVCRGDPAMQPPSGRT